MTLVVDELVTNAAVHAGTRIQVTVGRKHDLYRCVVRDECTDGPFPRIIETADGYGRGLRVVALLSVSWGVERDAAGTSVWAEIDGTGRVRVGPEPRPGADGSAGTLGRHASSGDQGPRHAARPPRARTRARRLWR